MQQQALDLSPPLPPAPKPRQRSTSAEAICDLTASGRLGEQQRKVLAAMVRIEGYRREDGTILGPAFGFTSRELADFADLDRYAVARRLPELAAQGLARQKIATRQCLRSLRRAVVWEPTEAGRQAIQEGLCR